VLGGRAPRSVAATARRARLRGDGTRADGAGDTHGWFQEK